MNGWIRGWVSLVLMVCGLLAVSRARALDPDRAIGQLSHVWYEDQLPQGTVLSIAQSKDGSIWLATYGGLVHHSGAEFDTIDPRVAPVLKSTAITAVYVDRDGTLWVGTLNDGLYRKRGRELEQVALPANIKSVFGIMQDRGGELWLTTNAGVARMGAMGFRLLGEESGFPPRGFYHAIVAEPARFGSEHRVALCAIAMGASSATRVWQRSMESVSIPSTAIVTAACGLHRLVAWVSAV